MGELIIFPGEWERREKLALKKEKERLKEAKKEDIRIKNQQIINSLKQGQKPPNGR